MRKLVLIAAMLMASASAHAGGFSFNVEGQKVRVNIPRGCSSLSCINVTAPGLADKFKDKDTDTSPSTTTATAPAPAPAYAPAPAAAPAPQAVAPAPVAQAPAPVAAPLPAQKVTVLPSPATDPNATIASAPAVSAPALTAPEPVVQPAPVPVAAPAPAPVQVAAAPAAPAATVAAPAPAAVQTASTPIGVWMSEKKEGKVRIEDCGGNLCGYAVDKNGGNGAKVLINMKPRGDKWAGRIHDTRSGGTYDSTIALRGTDKLKVQGCAFGGMFCGGETWTRIE
jgi:uncharacterized protein (DUF2147 family)